MKIALLKNFPQALYILFILLVIGTACTRRLAKVVKPSDLPPDLANTTLLVHNFEYQDPKIYDSFSVINTDSLQAKTGFTFTADENLSDKEIKEADAEQKQLDQARQQEHPLIVKTNENLESYNKKLAKAMKVSKYPYIIVGKDDVEKDNFSDLKMYRYVLMRRPELHCYTDPNGTTRLSYRYVHQFYDRQTKEYFTDIEIFSPKPWRTTKAIMMASNKNLRR